MGDILTSEQAEAVLKRDHVNIVRKAKEGKTLSTQERSILQQIANGDDDGEPVDTRAQAKTLVELARILGCSRPTLNLWRKMDGAPEPNSDSSHEVDAWRAFMEDKDLRGYKGKRGPGAEAGVIDNDLKARKLLAEIETKEAKLAIIRGESIPVEEVREFYGKRIAECISILRNRFENELPPILVGLEALDIKEKCGAVIDDVVDSFNRGKI